MPLGVVVTKAAANDGCQTEDVLKRMVVHPPQPEVANANPEVRDLPRGQRAVIVLRYYEGLPDLEIAGMLGCTTGTVRGYAARAMAALRIELTASADN